MRSIRAARLQCTAYYHNWWAEPVVYVVGAEIIPSSVYQVQSFSPNCIGNEATCADVSAPLQAITGRYGDAASPFNPPPTTDQPNAFDITRLVDKFKSVPGAPNKARAQLQPNLLELNADESALDVTTAVFAYKGYAYPHSGPCPCPSLAVCGALACAAQGTCTGSALPGLGGGSICVRACNGGANDDDPCIDDTHCPGGGTCGAGFCRDACGRCSP